MPTWIIENYTKEKSFLELVQSIKSSGFPLIEIRDDYTKDLLSQITGNVVVNGSISMCKLISKDLPDLTDGLICPSFRKYLCSEYCSRFGGLLFNDKYVIMSLNELNRQKFFVYGMLGKDGVVFLRPDSGEKPFIAQLVDIQDLNDFCITNSHIGHELVLVSTPKNIVWEGRFVCSGTEVIAQSTYKFQGVLTQIPSVPIQALDVLKCVLAIGYNPDPVFCVDICGTPDNEFFLLELSAFSSSGLYACDKKKIVDRVSEIAMNP